MNVAAETDEGTSASVRINLPEMKWQAWSKPGATGRVKMTRAFGKRVRVLELPPGFDEETWCDKGHQGFVLKGEFTVTLETGAEYTCKKDDAFVIPDKIRHRSRGTKSEATIVFVVDEL